MMTSSAVRTQSAGPTDQVENIKDTIESLVIAFILAFVFRGFLVEAFVIPTGSMAPTLYGKHGTQICPDCGWEYAYGLPDRHPERTKIRCPNCSWTSIDHIELPYHAPAHQCSERNSWFRPNLEKINPLLAERVSHLSFAPQSGDRILVFKWPFDLRGPLLEPEPWDVVVFKNPLNGEDNYIKRLIGKPNEVLEIIDGDIYTCPVDELSDQTRDMLEQAIAMKYELLQAPHGLRRSTKRLENLQKQISSMLSRKLKIRRKTPLAQKSLWQVVFHQDYLPIRSTTRRAPGWKALGGPAASSAWDTSTPLIRFDGLERSREAVEFAGKRIGDFYAYNFGGSAGNAEDTVSDLRMKFVVEYHGGDGVLGVALAKRDDIFTVEFQPDGQVLLKQTRRANGRSLRMIGGGRIEPWQAGKPIEIEFSNVDYRVCVTVNGQDTPLIETIDEDYAPVIARLRTRPKTPRPPRPRIYAEHLDLTLAHLVLERDVYYKDSSSKHFSGWGTAGNPIYLREGEYFVLGDNSPASQDSRLWTQPGAYLLERGEGYQVGTVPADQLIGKAFFIYWPSGYRIDWLPVFKNFGIIPNAGKMRWIR